MLQHDEVGVKPDSLGLEMLGLHTRMVLRHKMATFHCGTGLTVSIQASVKLIYICTAP